MAKYTATFGLNVRYNTPGCSCCSFPTEKNAFTNALLKIKFGLGVFYKIGHFYAPITHCLNFMVLLFFVYSFEASSLEEAK